MIGKRAICHTHAGCPECTEPDKLALIAANDTLRAYVSKLEEDLRLMRGTVRDQLGRVEGQLKAIQTRFGILDPSWPSDSPAKAPHE